MTTIYRLTWQHFFIPFCNFDAIKYRILHGVRTCNTWWDRESLKCDEWTRVTITIEWNDDNTRDTRRMEAPKEDRELMWEKKTITRKMNKLQSEHNSCKNIRLFTRNEMRMDFFFKHSHLNSVPMNIYAIMSVALNFIDIMNCLDDDAILFVLLVFFLFLLLQPNKGENGIILTVIENICIDWNENTVACNSISVI